MRFLNMLISGIEVGEGQFGPAKTDGAFIEVFAMHPDAESKSAENTDFFLSFYHCENMSALRKKYPNKTIVIMLEN